MKLSEYLDGQDIHPLKIEFREDKTAVYLYFSALDELELTILIEIFGRIVLWPQIGFNNENPNFNCIKVKCYLDEKEIPCDDIY